MSNRRQPADRSAHHRLTGRRVVGSGRVRRYLPMAAAILGVILVGLSALMLSHDRSLPQAFGDIPTGQADSVGPAASTLSLRTTSQIPPTSSLTSRSGRPPGGSMSTSAVGSPTRRPPNAPTPVVASAPTRVKMTDPTAVEPVGVPAHISLPSQHVTASITPVSTTKGVLQVPDDPARVGWWLGSALPGSPTGTTVLDGHIDSATAGVGAFWKLSSLDAGAQVTIQLQDGRAIDYEVVARRVYPKNAGLPSSLFSSTGPPTLLMISCGGPFDSDKGSYEDNIAVFAVARP